jgi:hypothetical protein
MVLTIKALGMLREDDYVRRGLECEFIHQKEERDYRSDPVFSLISADLDSKQYSKVVVAGNKFSNSSEISIFYTYG